MITSENNIKMHFFDYINRFIFRIIRTYTKKNLMVKGKEFRVLYKELNVVKKDIIKHIGMRSKIPCVDKRESL
jgi:hypothetical protein